MIIEQLFIANFRCFGPDETKIDFGDLTTIIGANSSGKSALLSALLKLFGRTGKEREIKRSDFHIPIGKKPEEIVENSLYIEATISFPELVKDEEYAKKTVPSLFRKMVVHEPDGDPYIRIRLEASWKQSNSPDGEIDSNISFISISRDEDEEISNENKHIAKLSDIRSNIQMIYVPAIREPSKELKNASGTILWRILNGINWPEDINEKINKQMEPVNSIFDCQQGVKRVQEIIQTQWKSYHKDYRYTKTKIKFTSSDLSDILDKIDIEFSPTEIPKSYNIDSLGEGLRSLFYLSLVSSLLDVEFEAQSNTEQDIFDLSPPALTILAVEEPENHISPQLLGKIIDNIEKISEKCNSQVFLTSHSPSIVKRIKPETIRHLRINKSNLCTAISTITLPPGENEIHKYVKEAVTRYTEIYFSRLVVFGEGDSESIIIPKAIETLGSKVDSAGISVVPLGGRFVNHFWKLLTNLEIPYITLLDLDSERAKGGWETIKYAITQLIENGHTLEEICDFEECESLSQGMFDSMHNRLLKTDTDRSKIKKWAEHLEKFGIYYSFPLDVDFSMLKAFEESYRIPSPGGRGPTIPDKNTKPFEYAEKMEKCIRHTLKESGGDGNTYSDNEKEFMLWYPYLFLDHGKPSTHILAMNRLDDAVFKEKMPDSLKRMVDSIKTELEDDYLSTLCEITEQGD